MAAPSVTVSMVATGSYNGVESGTRPPTSPAWLAAAVVTLKIRSGWSEVASRAHIPPARNG